MIPTGWRRVPVSFLIGMMSLMQQMSKNGSIALMWTIGKVWVALYFGIDHGIFMLYQICRKDFLSWVPMEGNFKYVFAFFARFAGKNYGRFHWDYDHETFL